MNVVTKTGARSKECPKVTPSKELELIRTATAYRVPTEISKSFISKVLLWEKCSGQEWTVSRIKEIKLDFIRIKAGLPPASKYVSFSGPLKGLLTFGFKHRKNFSKIINLLQIYTTMYAPNITEKQERKFLDGVSAAPTQIPPHLCEMLTLAVKSLGIKVDYLPDPPPYATMPVSESRRAPLVDGNSYPENENHWESLMFLTATKEGRSQLDRYPLIFGPMLEGIEQVKGDDHAIFLYSVGKIGLIQEPGFKLRAVANPGRVYQRALKPLGDAIYEHLKSLPWDCTHNQDKPNFVIRRHLREKRTAFAVDLTGATDYFPLDLQLTVLDSMFIRKDYIELFQELSRSPWWYQGVDGNRRLISWKRGQPLGLYPSFGSFALTHGLLLYALNGFKHHEDFYVLGDDVVILDETLYNRYTQCLVGLGCPFSPSKTITSSLLTEFGGKIFTKDEVLPQPKWRSMSDDNFIDILRNIGTSGWRLLKPRQRAVARVLVDIPEFLGGLGWNPRGLSLEERYRKYLDLHRDSSKSYLMSYNEQINRWNYSSGLKYSYTPDTFVSKCDDIDQMSISLVSKYLPRMLKYYEILGTNLFDVNNDLPLMIAGIRSRLTRLERLERQFAV